MAPTKENIEPPFNAEFCFELESRIEKIFDLPGEHAYKGFWCDGISPVPDLPRQLTKKSVNDTRQIQTHAWLGKTGQDKYEMTLLFGKYSLRRYARGTAMLDCIPGEDETDWIEIDTDKKTVIVHLK